MVVLGFGLELELSVYAFQARLVIFRGRFSGSLRACLPVCGVAVLEPATVNIKHTCARCAIYCSFQVQSKNLSLHEKLCDQPASQDYGVISSSSNCSRSLRLWEVRLGHVIATDLRWSRTILWVCEAKGGFSTYNKKDTGIRLHVVNLAASGCTVVRTWG